MTPTTVAQDAGNFSRREIIIDAALKAKHERDSSTLYGDQEDPR